MFHFRRLTRTQIDDQILNARRSPLASPRLLSLDSELAPRNLGAFAHDRCRSILGIGESVFIAAKHAFANWQMFDLGWVHVVNNAAPIEDKQIVAVEIQALGLWSVNLSQIVETIDRETEFGFIYATTRQHVEEGEESFVLRFNQVTGEVSYELEAVSRPRHILAKLGFPMARFLQHRFARNSHRRMRQAVNLNS